MVEIKVEALPEAVRSKPLKLGSCPHGVAMVTGTEVFMEYPQFQWNFRKETGKNSSESSEDFNASAKVSLFWGLVKGHVKYSKHKAAKRSKNAKTTQVTLRIQTGVKHLLNVKPAKWSHCSEGPCKNQPFYVSSVCEGGRACLSLSVDTADDSKSTIDEIGGGFSLFGMGREIGSEQSATEGNYHLQMHACYSSSIEDPVEIVSNSNHEVAQFMKGLKELEQKMLLFRENLFEMGSSDKLNAKYILEPEARIHRNEIVDDIQLKLDAMSKFESVLGEVMGVRRKCELLKGNGRVDHFASKIDIIIRKLKNLKHDDDIYMDKVMDIYGDHAVNFYSRELRRLTK